MVNLSSYLTPVCKGKLFLSALPLNFSFPMQFSFIQFRAFLKYSFGIFS